MARSTLRPSTMVALLAGVGLGWLASAMFGARPLQAQSADRWGDYAVATGAVHQQPGPGLGIPVPLDAVYYLNYRTGMLTATVPGYRSRPGGADVLGDFAERDLMADFDLKPGQTPHFLMTTASIGGRSEGWQPLFVFETTTGQVATYRAVPSATPASTKPTFELVERRADPRLGRSAARP